VASSYELRLDASASRMLQRIPERHCFSIVAFMTGPLLRAPWRVGKAMRFELHRRRSARIGPYCIVYLVDDDAGVVAVERIAHRADVYRPR
jgi:mRNA interferase RelE/StbE